MAGGCRRAFGLGRPAGRLPGLPGRVDQHAAAALATRPGPRGPNGDGTGGRERRLSGDRPPSRACPCPSALPFLPSFPGSRSGGRDGPVSGTVVWGAVPPSWDPGRLWFLASPTLGGTDRPLGGTGGRRGRPRPGRGRSSAPVVLSRCFLLHESPVLGAGDRPAPARVARLAGEGVPAPPRLSGVSLSLGVDQVSLSAPCLPALGTCWVQVAVSSVAGGGCGQVARPRPPARHFWSLQIVVFRLQVSADTLSSGDCRWRSWALRVATGARPCSPRGDRHGPERWLWGTGVSRRRWCRLWLVSRLPRGTRGGVRGSPPSPLLAPCCACVSGVLVLGLFAAPPPGGGAGEAEAGPCDCCPRWPG